MDRHRQEWLDYACSEEVLLDIKNEYLLIGHFWDSCMYCFIVYGQSKNATCEDYSRGDSSTGSSITPEMEDVTSFTPLQKSCENDGELELFFATVR